MKSVIIDNPKTSHNLSKTIIQAEQVLKLGSNMSLYCYAKKWKLKNNVKIAIQGHAFKGFANSNNVEIFYSFNPELQLKDIKTTIENKLKKLLAELRGFKFVTTLVLVFKKIKSDDKTK